MLILVVIERERERERAREQESERVWPKLPISMILKGKKNVLKTKTQWLFTKKGSIKKRNCYQPQAQVMMSLSLSKTKKQREREETVGVFFCVFTQCVLTDWSGLMVRRQIRRPHCWQNVSWVAGPSLTLHTKPWQDVLFKARRPRDSSKLSPLTFHAEHDFSGSSGSRNHLTMLRTATCFQCCLKQEKCLVYEWFFCKNKLM